MIARLASLIGLAALAAAGCGGGQTRGQAFDPAWTDDSGASAAEIQRELQGTRIPPSVSVAVGVTDKGKLVGAPLEGGATWTFTHALDSRPSLAGTVVVGLGRGELFALDARTGNLLWKRTAGGLLRGAGDDGATTVVSLQPATGIGSIVLAIDHDGHIIRQIEDTASIGVPAVVDGYTFLPWQGQYVAVYDLHTGEERARIVFRVLTSRAFTSGGALFFGENGLTRFDDRIRLAEDRGATRITLPDRELPGDPRWMRSGLETRDVPATEADKVRLYARPTLSGPPGIDGGRYAATYHRIAAGLDGATGDIAWAHTGEADFLGGDAFQGGFALCDTTGKITLLDGRRGAPAGQVSLGEPLTACVVQADSFARTSSEAAPSLAEQLGRAALLSQPELAPMQRVLLKQLSQIDDPVSARTLIALSEGEGTSPLLTDDARAMLAARRSSPEVMLEALGRHYDFLTGARRPPVGPIADALAAMREPRAAPLLAGHLNDPADSEDDIRRAAAALAVLATKAEREQLRGFLARYRGLGAPDVDAAIMTSVVSTAAALVKIGDAETVAGAANDPFTSADLKPRLAELLKGGAEKSASR